MGMTLDFMVNLNSSIKVKLTPMGKKILQDRHDDLREHVQSVSGSDIGPYSPRLDDNGYYTTQLWILMNVFGPYMTMGIEEPFDMSAIMTNGMPLEKGDPV